MRSPDSRYASAESFLHSLIDSVELARTRAPILVENAELLKRIGAALSWCDAAMYRALHHEDIEDERKQDVLDTIFADTSKVVGLIRALGHASTDAVPYALGQLLNMELQTLGLPGGRLAFYPVNNFNYTFLNVSSKLAKVLDQLVDTLYTLCRRFLPESLIEEYESRGFQLEGGPSAIGFQYAMRHDVLYNAVLFHELGHCCASRGNLRFVTDDVLVEVFELLEPGGLDRLEELTTDDKFVRDFRRYAGYLRSWADELFSDCFAAAIAGPQYAHATQDIFDPGSGTAAQTALAVAHPPDPLRHAQIWATLEQSGWTQAGANHDEFTDLARAQLEQLRPDDDLDSFHATVGRLTLREASHAQGLYDILTAMCDDIRAEAISRIPNLEARISEFWGAGYAIYDCLNRGIVPSTIHIAREAVPERLHPHPVVVMNVARVIFSDGCTQLRRNWLAAEEAAGGMGDDSDHEIKKRNHRHLSAWTEKAIEDWILLERRSGPA